MRRTSSHGIAVVTSLLAAAGLTACSQEATSLAGCETSYTIGFSHPVGEAAAPKAIKRMAAEYAEEKGCIDFLLDNTTASNLESQRATVEGWITQKVDAILLFPVDPSAFTNLQSQAQEQGIAWLTYATPMEGEDGGVGFDSEQAGTIVADDMSAWIEEHHPDGGISAAVTTLKALTTITGRWEKPEAALKRLGVPVVSMQDCADQTCGLQIAEDALRENPDLRVFIGLNDDAALGAQKAFENAGLSAEDVYIAGSDGAPEALENIKDPGAGAFRTTAALEVLSLAHDIVDNSLAAITGDGETSSLTPAVLAKTGDDATIDELLAQLNG
ncbi:sugar ABC transporter substrate-binding protein [Nocardioides sp. L-11A]|uniref:sugar ABC transporter substrate-binding protein n=1 Tax=Nocardioides sp. L-11A TaxID=3043848 RepID=UPI00249A48C8|nr:sugar ABC transporter substrate-binding protein [Nocardioides sp. L-11A]